MADSQPKKWGVTNPISDLRPTKEDMKLNDSLIEYLKAINNFETPEGTDRRVRVLHHLQKVTEEFVKRVGRAKGFGQSTIDSLGGKIFTYGSYTLGVHGPDSDIDTLVVAPKSVNQDDYFEYFPVTFKEMSNPELISEFVPVPDAFVPIIKLEYDGVSIDLIFASMPSQSVIPKDFEMHDQSVLRGLTQQAMRSVNGTRVAKELLELVPQKTVFKHALRAIKVWSTKRAIYGFVFGFPGGIAWALMVARVCQLYPYACGSTIVAKFFHIMQQWPWPRPIMLKEAEQDNILNLQIWNPTINYSDRAHLMPVITPAYPSMCATHSVTRSTLKIMTGEFQRAFEIITAIQAGKKTWADLFQKHTFFTEDHGHYLSVIASSTSDKNSFDAFAGLAQSKVRLLVKAMEEGHGTGIEQARIFMKGIERVHRCKDPAVDAGQLAEIRAGSTKYQITSAEAQSGNNGEGIIVYTTTWYVGLTLESREGEKKSLDISYPVEEFRNLVMAGEMVVEDTMAIKVVHTRSYDLPDDLFEPGETKPVKPVKPAKAGKDKKDAKKKKSNGTKNKRPFAETGLEDSEMPSKKQAGDANGIPMPTPA